MQITVDVPSGFPTPDDIERLKGFFLHLQKSFTFSYVEDDGQGNLYHQASHIWLDDSDVTVNEGEGIGGFMSIGVITYEGEHNDSCFHEDILFSLDGQARHNDWYEREGVPGHAGQLSVIGTWLEGVQMILVALEKVRNKESSLDACKLRKALDLLTEVLELKQE